MKGYEYKVFLDFIELYDHNGELSEFYKSISSHGYQSISQEFVKFRLSKIVGDLSKVINKENWYSLISDEKQSEVFIKQFREIINNLYDKIELDKIRFEYESLNLIKTLQVINSLFTKLRNRKTLPKKLKKSLEEDFNEVLVNNNTFFNFLLRGVFELNKKNIQNSKFL